MNRIDFMEYGIRQSSVTDMDQPTRRQVMNIMLERFNGEVDMKNDIKTMRRYRHQAQVEVKELGKWMEANWKQRGTVVYKVVHDAWMERKREVQNYTGMMHQRQWYFDHLKPRTKAGFLNEGEVKRVKAN